MSLLETTATVLPIVCTGLFVGVHICIRYSLFPAMISLDDTDAIRYFAGFYPPLALIQPGLLALAALASLLRLTLTAVPSSLAYAVHVAVVVHLAYIVGWTFTVMLEDNKRLLAAADKKWTESRKGETRTMLTTWGERNEARVWPGLILFVLLVVAETGKH